ncbi:MAG TPA: hypothetical protein VMT38_04850 [Terracidiphilus sp.]|nr:hypothetical protein [Terracidiphilus sp.]
MLRSIQMRRGFSIYLVLFLALGPLAAMAPGSDDSLLPPCCRRHGAHHCAMYAEIIAMRARFGPDPRPRFEAPSTCPLFPGLRFGMLAPAHALVAAAAGVRVNRVLSPAPAIAPAIFASCLSNAYSGRGPPRVEPS